MKYLVMLIAGLFLSQASYAQIASSTQYGVVKYDPASFSTVGGVLKMVGGAGGSYTLPIASATTLGGVKIGSGLTMTGDVLSVTASAAPSYPAGDYSQTGSVIDDGGGSYNNEAGYNSAKVFDGFTNTFYNTAGDPTGAYVGRNLGTAKAVNQVTLVPRQDAGLADRINGSVVQYSSNGTTWNTVYTVAGVTSSNYTQVITASFAYVTAQYWRLYWANSGGQGNVAEMTITSTGTASGGSSGGSSGGTTFGTYVTDHTSAGVQAAITAAAAGSTLVFDGTYVWTSEVICSKALNFVAPNGAVFSHDGAQFLNFMLKINNYSGGYFEKIKFSSAATSMTYGMVFGNEESPITNITFFRCEFTCPSGNFNGLSFNAWSDQAGSGTYHNGINVFLCYFHDIGRIGIEFTAHAWNGTVRIKNINVQGNRFDNLGLGDDNGMAVSNSGENAYIIASNNIITGCRAYGIEFIGGSNFVCSGNTIQTTKTFGGSNNYGTTGINMTDGGNTERNPSNPNRGARNGTVSNNTIEVSGRPYILYYANDIALSDNRSNVGLPATLQHSDRNSFTGESIDSKYQSCIIFDNSNENLMTGGRLTTVNAVGAKYGQIWFQFTAKNNSVSGTSLWGLSDNGFQISVDGAGVPATNGSTGNRWRALYGGKYVDSNQGIATFTANGSATTFTITHGLGYQPAQVLVSPSLNTNYVGYTSTGTTVVLSYSVAPSNGTVISVPYSLN